MTCSNSLFFETDLNWNGIYIEPLKEIFGQLRKNRKCVCIESAISSEEGIQDFLEIEGPDMLSGLVKELDPRHVQRINYELQNSKGNARIAKVKTITLQSVLDLYNIKYVDFISIDTEGAEFSVVNSIDYNKLKFGCMLIENNYDDPKVRDFLYTKGYTNIGRLTIDDVYLNNELLNT